MGLPCDWQISKQKVSERAQYLLETGQWSDCKFVVGQEPHQQSLKAHKMFLAIASPVFEAMFFGGMAEKDEPIQICDVQPDAFKALLEYIYTDQVTLTSFELACELCYCAKKYMLPHLVEECTKYLWADLCPKKACRAYEFAKLFEEPVLMEKCLQIICTRTSEILRQPSWLEVEQSTLHMILDQDELQIESEIELYIALERWAKAECARKSLDETNMKSLRSVIGDALTKIRFLTLTSLEFVKGIALSPLLEQEEAYAILLNILSGGDNAVKPMPEGFCVDTRSRVKSQIINLSCPGIKIPMPERFSDDAHNRNKALKSQNRGYNVPISIRHIECPTSPQPTTSYIVHTGWRNRNFRVGNEDQRRTMTDESVGRRSPLNESSSSGTCNGNGARPLGLGGFIVDNVTLDPYTLAIRHERREPDNSANESTSNDNARRDNNLPENNELSLNDREGMRVGPKYYCHRTLVRQSDCLNTNLLDSTVTFSVDKNICVMGVQVPAQIPGAGSSSSHNASDSYTEVLYAHLLDSDGTRLTYTHFTTKARLGGLVEVMFDRPVYIQRHRVYRVGVLFNKFGWYPMGVFTQNTICDSVYFSFGIGDSADNVKDGLIRSIVFTYH